MRTFDLSPLRSENEPECSRDPRIVRIRGDVRDKDALLSACAAVDCIFHVASFGMSGKEMVNVKMTREVRPTGVSAAD